MRRTGLLICGTAVAALALAGCGQSSIAGSATANGGNNPAASGGGGVGGVISVAQLGDLVSANTNKKETAHFSLQVTGTVGISSSGEVRFGSPLAMDETTNVPQMGDLEIRVLDNIAYLKLPASIAQMEGATKPWVKLDPNGNNPLDKAMAGSLQTAQQDVDPSAMLNKIKSAGTITATSHEQVNGENTTHYTITVDPKKLTTNVAGLGTDANMLPNSMTVDYWVNSDNLPVKFSTAATVQSPTGGAPIQVNVTGNFTDWGQPVNITAPPADQVGSLGG